LPERLRSLRRARRSVPDAWAWGALAALAYSGLVLRGSWAEHMASFLALYACAWSAAWGASRSRGGTLPIVLGAALFRALLLAAPPTLSDDIHRYVWEGRIQAAGHNPYVRSPADPELAPLRDAGWPRINNPLATAIYPPLAEIEFNVLARLGGVRAFKTCASAADLSLVLVLAWALRRRREPPERLALYAWNPLAVVEVAGSGHLEPLAVLPLVLALLAARAHRTLGWCALAASIATKYAAVLVAPQTARAAPPRPASVVAALVLLGVVTLPYVDAGARLFDSLGLYAAKWRYNDLLFRVLYAATGSLASAKAAAAAAVLGVIAVCVRRRLQLERAALVVFLWALLLSPTVHPWYLLWPAALLPLVPSAPLFAWTGSAVLGYAFLYPVASLGPAAMESWIPGTLQMLPVAAGWWWERGTARGPRGRSRGAAGNAPGLESGAPRC
jgi:hypothetical protein